MVPMEGMIRFEVEFGILLFVIRKMNLPGKNFGNKNC